MTEGQVIQLVTLAGLRAEMLLRGSTFNQSINQSINQLYLNTVNGSASWFSDMPCDNYNL